MEDLKESVNFGHGRVDALELKSNKLDLAINEAKEALEKRTLEVYSRPENLKFAGIPEGKEDQENTKEVLAEFLSKQLGIDNPNGIEYQRVHRIGKKGDRPRMIIARFLRYADREKIMSSQITWLP